MGAAADQRLIFACSGAADVGEIADKAARKLTRDGKGRMFCTAGSADGSAAFSRPRRRPRAFLAIDGCPLNCAKSSSGAGGVHTFKHLQLADLGLEKCKSPVTEESVNKVAARAAEMIGS